MTEQASPPRLSAFFATREALGLRTFVTVSIMAVIAGATAVPSSDSRSMLTWLGAAVVAQVAAGAVIGLGWWMSGRSAAGRTQVILTLLVAYAARGVVLVAVTDSLGATDTTSPLVRITTSMINMTVWSLLAGAVWQARADYHRGLEAALQRVFDARAQADLGPKPSSDVERTQQRLLRVLDRYRPEDATTWARELQSVIESDLRPLSHRLARGPSAAQRQWVRLRQILWRAVRQPIPVIAIAVILSTFAIANAAVRYDGNSGIASALVYVVLLAGTVGLDRVIRDTTRSDTAAKVMVSVMMVIAVPLALLAVPDHLVALDNDVPSIAALGASAGILIVGFAVLQGSIDLNRATVGELNDEVDALDVVIEAQWRAQEFTQQQTARHLHNTVQSHLTAVRLEAGRSPTAIDHERIEAARRLVATSLAPPVGQPIEDLRRAIRSWSGLLEVELQIDPEIRAEDPRVGRLCSFAQEAIANAVRHGRANHVVVTVETTQGSLRCSVTDNGHWRTGSAPRLGLGLDQGLSIAVSTDSGCTRVVAELP